MQRIGDLTLREASRAVSRYNPFLITVVAIALIAMLVPGDDHEPVEGGMVQDRPADGAQPDPSQPGAATVDDEANDVEATDASLADEGDHRSMEPERGAPREHQPTAMADVDAWAEEDAIDAPDCDPDTGRMKIPSVYAPQCVPRFIGDPPGSDHPGVDEETIRVVVYEGEQDDQARAMLTAQGWDAASADDVHADIEEYAEIFESHLETYGRKIDLHFFEATGGGDEEARADAIYVAEELNAFISLGGAVSARLL